MEPGRHIYFIGIGGIGMSALARFFHAAGYPVAGYDLTPSDLTEALVSEGIQISYEDDFNTVPEEYRSRRTLVVRTPAVPQTNLILSRFREGGNEEVKRSQLLAQVAEDKRCLAVAGTHGKTTTSAILAHIMHGSSMGCTAFVGGVLSGYERNVLIDPESDFLVLEADEFDRSFHVLSPESAVVTATDPDHLDIYSDQEGFEQAFLEFADRLNGQGRLFYERQVELFEGIPDATNYGIQEGDVFLSDYRLERGIHHFDLQFSADRVVTDLSFPIPGRHNLSNAIAASCLALESGLDDHSLRKGLAGFPGVKRRFERIIERDDLVFVDDYAHHPREIEACIQATRERYPGKHITAVFQPHLFSRTRDFMQGFADALSNVDHLILLPIYPAREEPIAGVSSEVLLDRVLLANKKLCEKALLADYIADMELEVLLTMGAGDIDRSVPLIHQRLQPSIR